MEHSGLQFYHSGHGLTSAMAFSERVPCIARSMNLFSFVLRIVVSASEFRTQGFLYAVLPLVKNVDFL